MGERLMPATHSKTVATELSQPSQYRTTLRQCDSCPYPFRDRAPTVALSREGCWRKNQSVANTTRRPPLWPRRGAPGSLGRCPSRPAVYRNVANRPQKRFSPAENMAAGDLNAQWEGCGASLLGFVSQTGPDLKFAQWHNSIVGGIAP